MTRLTEQVAGERQARMMLSMIAEPHDAITDRVLHRVGGVDRPYPRGNSDLQNRIGDLGELVSEMPSGASPTRWRFMARARLLGTLSGATVVAEAGFRSGSLLVPTVAHRHSRAVGGVPGPVTSAASAGAHELIKRGRAKIITDTADVTAMLDSRLAARYADLRHPAGGAATVVRLMMRTGSGPARAETVR